MNKFFKSCLHKFFYFNKQYSYCIQFYSNIHKNNNNKVCTYMYIHYKIIKFIIEN
jgi:hypothetical protein